MMVLLPVGNFQEVEARMKKEGKPKPDRDAMIAAGRASILKRWADAGFGDVASMIEVAPACFSQSVIACRRLMLSSWGMSDNECRGVQHEFVYDPLTWQNKYNLKNGSVFGLSHGLLQLACFRPPTQSGLPDTPWWADSPKIENLYFVGASTRPGNGVPLVLMGVAVQAENILKKFNVPAVAKQQ